MLGGVMRLNYSKAGEACEVRIIQGGLFSPTEIYIEVFARSG
jgi:hypothetical protein